MSKRYAIRSQIIWREHVARWLKGKQSQAEYCRKHNIAESTFSYYVSKKSLQEEIQLVKIPSKMLNPNPHKIETSGICLEFPNGIKLQIENNFVSDTLVRVAQNLVGL